MQERLTIDLDSKHYVLSSIAEILKYNNIDTIIMQPSRKGWHIIIWLINPVTNREHFRLRRLFLDDPKRIIMDKSRYKKRLPIQVLFQHKYFTKRFK